MGKSAQRFTAETQAESRKIVAQAADTIRGIGQQAFHDLSTDAKTLGGYGAPVASGRLAGSMRIALNQIDGSAEPADRSYRYPPGKGPRPLPPRTIPNVKASTVAAILRRFKLGDVIYISNSVPYIRRVELHGHSWQTPGGVFGPTIRKLLRQFKGVLR